MATVTFPGDLGGDGLTVTDDANPDTGLAAGGHRLRFVPALNNTVAMARTAADQAAAAKQSETAAAASRSAAKSSETRAANSASAANSSKTAAADSAKAAARSAESVGADQIMHKRGSGLANEVGTAATRNVGTADGELMEVGAFGVGAINGQISEYPIDIDADPSSVPLGWYYVGSGSLPSGPGMLQIERSYSGRTTMTYTRDFRVNWIWSRTHNPEAPTPWTPWDRHIKQSEIVGSLPGPAVIDSGTTSTGYYIKWADGTLMCWTELDLTYQDNYALTREWSFPVTFAARPWDLQGSHAYTTASNVSVAPSNIGPVGFFYYGGTTFVGARVFRNPSSSPSFAEGDRFRVRINAKGRWKS